MERVICLAIGYVFGLFQTAFIYGKMNHIDIREHGSGNAGTTNALRVLGKKAGLIVFLGDVFKCFFAVELVRLLFKHTYPDILPLLSLYAAAGAILGHNFPFYLQFKGGKGIAATAGLILAFHWPFLIVNTGLLYFVFYNTLCFGRFTGCLYRIYHRADHFRTEGIFWHEPACTSGNVCGRYIPDDHGICQT